MRESLSFPDVLRILKVSSTTLSCENCNKVHVPHKNSAYIDGTLYMYGTEERCERVKFHTITLFYLAGRFIGVVQLVVH